MLVTNFSAVTTITKPVPDATITLAEYNLLRRLRQVKRAKIADAIYIDLVTGTLRLVGKPESFDVSATIPIDS